MSVGFDKEIGFEAVVLDAKERFRVGIAMADLDSRQRRERTPLVKSSEPMGQEIQSSFSRLLSLIVRGDPPRCR